MPTSSTARAIALETVSKEGLYEYYSCHTRKDTCKYFNITDSTLMWLLKFYKIKKSKEQKRDTIQRTYGDKFYKDRKLQSDKTKIQKYGSLEEFEKFRSTRQREGLIEKYGSMDNYIDHMTNSLRNTYMERYGVENISQLDLVKKKKEESMINNFGSLENAYKERQIKSNETWINKYGSLENYRIHQQELSRQTCLEKYGVDNPFASKEIQEDIKNTCIEKYGVEYACMIDTCRSNGNNNSKPNIAFMKLLEDNDIKIDCREFVLGNYIYDFKVGELLIEINPSATHNSTWSPFGHHIGISKYYHQIKSQNAFNFGYRCIHVFDWTDKDNLINNIKNNKYEVYDQKFLEPKLYIYNMKKKMIEDVLSDDCVEIYDDGITIDNGGV